MITVKQGFIDIYGNKWTSNQIERYNKISLEIAQKEKNGFIAEDLKDSRAIQYNMPQMIKKESKQG